MKLIDLHAAIRGGSLNRATSTRVSARHINSPLVRGIERVIRQSALGDQRRPSPPSASVGLLP